MLDPALANRRHRDRGIRGRDRPTRLAAAARARRPDAADDVVAEPDRQRGEVPARRVSRPGSSIDCERAPDDPATSGCSPCPTTASASPRVRRQGLRHLPAPARPGRLHRHRHRPGAVQEDRRIPRRRHLDRHRPTPAGTRFRFTLPAAVTRPPSRPFRKERTHDRPTGRADRRAAHRGRSGRRADHPGSLRAQQDQQHPARRARRRGRPGLPVPAGRSRGRPRGPT